ncbi:PfkB family carbohydrate kinase [Microbacterium sp. NPDC019599]|uniref:PfkB family carbohydrate kinase n=1 Tax=Microbacterium sp. NPDC019599 TaxID=3154690 RepID=UPI0033F74DE6
MKVAVVGSVNMDVVARVAHVPAPGETLLARSWSRGGGGKGANQAVAAARAAAASVAFIGAVGDDGDGQALRAGLESDGIDVTGLESAEAPTGVALISVGDDGENAIVVVAGANATASPLSPQQTAVVADADVVVAQLEIPVERVLEASRLRRPDALFVLNASPSAPFGDNGVADRLLSACDVLIVNEHELRDVARTTAADLWDAVDAVAERVGAVVVTLGSQGSIVAVGAERRSVAAFPARAVDTTGAGDTYCGVLAARLGARRDGLTIDAVADAARVAGAAAALAVGRHGAQASVPTADEVDDFLKETS